MRSLEAFLIAAACCVGAVAPAAAQSQINTSMTHFTYTLTDLDLTDGITPSLIFEAPTTDAASYAAIGDPSSSAVDYGTYAFEPVAASLSTPELTGSASVSGSISANLALNTDLATNTPAGRMPSAVANVSSGYLGFVLSPMTAVSFLVDVSTDLAVGQYPFFAGDPAGFSAASLFLTPSIGEGAPGLIASNSFFVRPGSELSDDVTLQLTQSNALSSTVSGYLNAYIQIGVVPEPSTWLMLLAGASVLFLTARRARKYP